MMMNETTAGAPAEANPAIILTQAAAKKVWQLIEGEGDYSLNLRVYVMGGGCAGFQYGFTFDNTVREDDDTVIETPVEKEGDGGPKTVAGHVRLLVDALSFQYLTGAEIDYKEDIKGAHFVINNPNAQTTCGCGSSFSA